MKTKIFSNKSLLYGIVSWLILIIIYIIYYIGLRIEDMGLRIELPKFLELVIYGLFVFLIISFFVSGFLSITGIILAIKDYFKKNKKIKLLLLNIAINLSYLITYILILYMLVEIGKGV